MAKCPHMRTLKLEVVSQFLSVIYAWIQMNLLFICSSVVPLRWSFRLGLVESLIVWSILIPLSPSWSVLPLGVHLSSKIFLWRPWFTLYILFGYREILFGFPRMWYIFMLPMNQTNWVKHSPSSTRLFNEHNFELKIDSFGSLIKFNELIIKSNLKLFLSWFGSLSALICIHKIVSLVC